MEDNEKVTQRNFHTGPNMPGKLRRAKILKSVSELLENSSCLDISFDEIAENAGLPVSSCYHYYANKWEVCKSLDDMLARRLIQRLDLVGDGWPPMQKWPDIVVEFTARCRLFAEANPIAGEIWFKNKVPDAAASSSARNNPFATQFEALFDRLFVLPEMEGRRRIFYVTGQILDSFLASLWLTDLDHDWIWREMNRSMIAYISLYLPQDLPKRDIAG